jgi:hypothetical protein
MDLKKLLQKSEAASETSNARHFSPAAVARKNSLGDAPAMAVKSLIMA